MIQKSYGGKKGSFYPQAAFWLFLLLFFLTNLWFLTRFPAVHSDESWLAGLTRTMMENHSLAVTEPFFDLKPRNPHAIKSLFHLLQMPFIALFGYRIFSVRLLSLLSGCVVLVLFRGAVARLSPGAAAPLVASILLACDVQFLYAAHFARQEILICAAICACIRLFLQHDEMLTGRTAAALGLITGFSIGLHPNSFLIACMCGCIFLVRILIYKTASFRQLGIYAAVTGGFALCFVLASFAMDPDFIRHYLAYGESEFDLLVPVTSKAAELGIFFKKLWYSVSGTYYLPNLKPQLLLFPLLMLCALAYAAVMRRDDPAQSQRLAQVVCAAAGILAGMILIGRYNQTSIVFFAPLGWMLFPFVCTMFGKKTGRGIFAAVAAVILLTSAQCIRPWLSKNYATYLEQIAQFVEPDAKVVGNLNSDFYFQNGCLLDYRNLSYLKENGLSFADYIQSRGIEYLLISEELDYIYSVRPKWNIIYGNPAGYYEQMQTFLRVHCQKIGSFKNPVYGVRMQELVGSGKYDTVTVYQVER